MAFLGSARAVLLELETLCPQKARQAQHYAKATRSNLGKVTSLPNGCLLKDCLWTSRVLGSWYVRLLPTSHVWCHRSYTTGNKKSDIVERKEEKKFSELTLSEKVTQTGKDVSYLAVVVAGVGITGLLFYLIGREIFSSQSPSGVYGSTLKVCRNNVQVQDALGEPIKGYGETTSRGRRRHVSHLVFNRGGVEHIQMKFYIEGPRQKGTVHLEMKKNDQGKYEYNYLIVELDSAYPKRNLVIEDNRHKITNFSGSQHI